MVTRGVLDSALVLKTNSALRTEASKTQPWRLHTIRNLFTQLRAASRAKASDVPAVNRNSEKGFLSAVRVALKCSHWPHDSAYFSPISYGRLNPPANKDEMYSIPE